MKWVPRAQAAWRNNDSTTSAGVAPPTQLRVLDASGCNQPSLDDGAFINLLNLRELGLWGYTQQSITDACLVPLRRPNTLRSLDIYCCTQLSDAVLEGVTGLSHLCYIGSGVSDAAATRALGGHGRPSTPSPTLADAVAAVHPGVQDFQTVLFNISSLHA